MARLPYLDKEDLKPEDQELLARGINLQKILVHSLRSDIVTMVSILKHRILVNQSEHNR